MKFNNASNLLELASRVTIYGGVIVSANDCTMAEIIKAKQEGRAVTNYDGETFIHRTHNWLHSRSADARHIKLENDWVGE